MTAHDGRLVGLFLIVRHDDKRNAVEIVGEIATSFDKSRYICRDLQATDQPCLLLSCVYVLKEIENDRAAIFATERACLQHFTRSNEKEVISKLGSAGFKFFVEEEGYSFGSHYINDVREVSFQPAGFGGFDLTLHLKTPERTIVTFENVMIDAAHVEVDDYAAFPRRSDNPPKALAHPRERRKAPTPDA